MSEQKKTVDTRSIPLVVERVVEAQVERVWRAITDRDEMKKWYFDLEEFRPEVGFEFRFYGGTKEKQYLHLCRVVEVVHLRRISYSWRYDGYEGDSLVTIELRADGSRTTVTLTHEGLETFPSSNPDLARDRFAEGWNSLIGSSLKEFVEATH